MSPSQPNTNQYTDLLGYQLKSKITGGCNFQQSKVKMWKGCTYRYILQNHTEHYLCTSSWTSIRVLALLTLTAFANFAVASCLEKNVNPAQQQAEHDLYPSSWNTIETSPFLTQPHTGGQSHLEECETSGENCLGAVSEPEWNKQLKQFLGVLLFWGFWWEVAQTLPGGLCHNGFYSARASKWTLS